MDEAEVSIGYYRGPLDRVLDAVDAARLDGAILVLDGAHTDDVIAMAESLGAYRRRGPGMHIPIEGDNLARVRALLDHHPDIEVADRLHVEDDRGCLLFAPGVGNNEIWVDERLPTDKVEALKAALGDNLTPTLESIGHYKGPVSAVLQGLQDANLQGTLLELDVVDEPDIDAFINERAAKRPDLVKHNHQARYGYKRWWFIRFVPEIGLLLPIEDDTFQELRPLIEQRPGYLMHLHVHDERGPLVEAHDIGDNDIWVSERLSPEQIAALHDALKGGLGPPS